MVKLPKISVVYDEKYDVICLIVLYCIFVQLGLEPWSMNIYLYP